VGGDVEVDVDVDVDVAVAVVVLEAEAAETVEVITRGKVSKIVGGMVVLRACILKVRVAKSS